MTGNTDDYGSPQADPISAPAPPPPSSSDYTAPQSPVSTSYSNPPQPVSTAFNTQPPANSQLSQSNALLPQSQYGSGATNTFSAAADPIIVDNSVPFTPSAVDSYNTDVSSIAQSSPPASAPDSYGVAQSAVLPPAPDVVDAYNTDISSIGPSAAPLPAPDSYLAAKAPAPAPDSYGVPQSSVLPPVLATTARSFTVDYDDYDPDDVPADQAAPELPGYGISSTVDSLDVYGVASNSPALPEQKALPEVPQDYYDYDPLDVPADQVRISTFNTHKLTAVHSG